MTVRRCQGRYESAYLVAAMSEVGLAFAMVMRRHGASADSLLVAVSAGAECSLLLQASWCRAS